MNWKEHITSDDKVLLGKPIIKGTRISVEHILSLLAQGWSEQQILENYPRLSKVHIQAVFAFVHENLQDSFFIDISRRSA